MTNSKFIPIVIAGLVLLAGILAFFLGPILNDGAETVSDDPVSPMTELESDMRMVQTASAESCVAYDGANYKRVFIKNECDPVIQQLVSDWWEIEGTYSEHVASQYWTIEYVVLTKGVSAQ